MKITKAVIPCGGMGTRFMPITKSVPKEILPIIDAPALSYIVDEAADSGITDVMLVLGPGKDAIKDYFSPNPALEDALNKAGKPELAELINKISKRVNIVYGYQPKPLGSGDAVLKAESFTGGEPFCLAWGDDVIDADIPVMAQLVDAFERVNSHIVGVQYWAGDDIVKYGVAKIFNGNDENESIKDKFVNSALFRCAGFMEKPPLNQIPSRYAALGRYLLTSGIYNEIRSTKPGKNGELQLTDAVNSLCTKSRVYAYDFKGTRYDMGDKLGSIKAIIEFGLKRDFALELKQYLEKLLRKQ